MTTVPPMKLVTDGTSLKHTHTHAIASGASSVLINAFSVADTIWPPIVSSMRPRPNWVAPNRTSFSRSIVPTSSEVENGQTRSGQTSADRHAAGGLGFSWYRE